jgi:hypothetical protein
LNSRSFCLSLPSAGITGLYCLTSVLKFILLLFSFFPPFKYSLLKVYLLSA